MGRTDTSCTLVGSLLGAPIHSTAIMLGFMLVGPHNTYPEHGHAAHEGYHVVGGEGWFGGGLGLQLRGAGEVMVHQPHQPHAMETGGHQVLVCWVNSGDTFGEYYFL